MMKHRKRFHAMVGHAPADRVAYDLCGSGQTSIDYAETRVALARYCGFECEGDADGDTMERVLQHLDIDTRKVGGMPTPPTVHCREEGGVWYNNYGIGHRLVNGHYEICHNPLKDCTLDEVMAYPLPEVEQLDRAQIDAWARQAKWLHENTDYAVVAEHPVLGVFEIGCWLFGFDDYLYRLAAEPETVHAFSQRIMAYQEKLIPIYYGALGRYIDCTTSGDDFGTQTGPFMSLDMFKEYIVPYYRRRIGLTKQYTDAFYMHHTCGSVHPFIPLLIGCGVDILNPIQPGAFMMEPERLKQDYGDRITFWGGIDTQHLLPEGAAEDVKGQVGKVLDILAPGGGYILAPAHCIQNDVPAENIAAIYRGADEYSSSRAPGP